MAPIEIAEPNMRLLWELDCAVFDRSFWPPKPEFWAEIKPSPGNGSTERARFLGGSVEADCYSKQRSRV